MESPRALSDPPSALGRHLNLVAAREHGVSAEQLPRIGTDPELFDAFYGEHLEDLQCFVARRVGDRERAADLTADVFIAAIDSAHRYRPRGTPKAWLYGIARVVIAEDRRRGARGRRGCAAAPSSMRRRRRGSSGGSTRRRGRGGSMRRWTAWARTSGWCWSWSRSTN